MSEPKCIVSRVTLFTLSLFIIPINNSCSSVSVTRLQVLNTELRDSLNLNCNIRESGSDFSDARSGTIANEVEGNVLLQETVSYLLLHYGTNTHSTSKLHEFNSI